MARTQFTFTFTNAQPGAAVSFLSTPVFADASTSVPDGPTLVLSAGNTVSVWADAEALVAYTVDGNGLVLSATATASAPSVTSADGTPGQNPFGGGSGVSTIFGPFPVAFDSANITTTGVPLLTVPDGAVVLDVWIDGGADGAPWDAAATAQVNTPDLGFSAFYNPINLEGVNYNGSNVSGGFTVPGGAVLDALLVDANSASTGYLRARNVSGGPLDLVLIVTGAGPWTTGKAYVFIEIAVPPFPTVP